MDFQNCVPIITSFVVVVPSTVLINPIHSRVKEGDSGSLGVGASADRYGALFCRSSASEHGGWCRDQRDCPDGDRCPLDPNVLDERRRVTPEDGCSQPLGVLQVVRHDNAVLPSRVSGMLAGARCLVPQQVMCGTVIAA